MDTNRRRTDYRDINRHQFDIHLSHACNFTCESCSHYSNYHFSGNLALETAELWYQKWSQRLRPFRINLLGGEPAINPKMTEHILLARKYWPKTELYLYTNGFLLHRHPQFPAAVQPVGNFIIKLSRHYNSEAYEQTFEQVVALLQSWKQQHGIDFAISDSYTKWTKRYTDQDGTLSPFQDNNPKQSWEICNAKYCLQLHEGKLWKCPILAYLPMAKQKVGLAKEWDPYLTYKPLEADCSQAELEEFLARREESFCSACPAFARPFPKNDPTKPVKRTLPAPAGAPVA